MIKKEDDQIKSAATRNIVKGNPSTALKKNRKSDNSQNPNPS
jgi:hypothetical protein